MAQVDPSSLSKPEHDSLACGYAALLLHDDGLEITVPSHSLKLFQGEKIAKILKASGNNVEPYWPNMFAKAL